MSMTQPDSAGTMRAEALLLGDVHGYARFVDETCQTPPGWRFPTSSHLLLEHGRWFAPGPLPAEIRAMPAQFCFINAAVTACRHGLLYAEGIAGFAVGDEIRGLAHGWCVAPDGSVVDPTWDPDIGVAYLGIAFTDRALWPTDNVGLLDNHLRNEILLRGGIAPGSTADLGRPVIASSGIARAS